MKRSTVNEIIRESDKFIRSFGYVMPPFAYWSADEMVARTGSDRLVNSFNNRRNDFRLRSRAKLRFMTSSKWVARTSVAITTVLP